MGEPADFVFVGRPCCEGVAVEAMNSHDTNSADISVCVTRKGYFAHSISASGPGEYSSLIPNNCWLFEFAMTRFCTASAEELEDIQLWSQFSCCDQYEVILAESMVGERYSLQMLPEGLTCKLESQSFSDFFRLKRPLYL